MVESIEIKRSRDGTTWIATAKISPSSPIRLAPGVNGGGTSTPWLQSDETFSPEAALEQVMTRIGRAAARLLIVEPTPTPSLDVGG